MKLLRAFLLVGILTVGLAGSASAQFGFSVGGPYSGGISNGFPSYGYSSGYSSFSGVGGGLGYGNNFQSYSNTGYLAGPGVIGGQFGYNSGYSGLGGINSYGYGSQLNYSSYGYNSYGTGLRNGFAPFRSVNSFRRFR